MVLVGLRLGFGPLGLWVWCVCLSVSGDDFWSPNGTSEPAPAQPAERKEVLEVWGRGWGSKGT